MSLSDHGEYCIKKNHGNENLNLTAKESLKHEAHRPHWPGPFQLGKIATKQENWEIFMLLHPV
jgi:hypothetical protein